MHLSASTLNRINYWSEALLLSSKKIVASLFQKNLNKNRWSSENLRSNVQTPTGTHSASEPWGLADISHTYTHSYTPLLPLRRAEEEEKKKKKQHLSPTLSYTYRATDTYTHLCACNSVRSI